MISFIRMWLIALSGCFIGCAGGLPTVHPYDANAGYFDEYYQKAGQPGFGGRDFCRRLEMSARTNSVTHRTVGWASGVLALAAAGTGAGIAATDQPESGPGKNRYKVAVVTLPLVAGLFAYLTGGQFSMADNSSALASAAAAAANGADADANSSCNSAMATWNSDSATATAAFSTAVGKLNQAKEAEKNAKQAEEDAKKAKADADKAKADADKTKEPTE